MKTRVDDDDDKTADGHFDLFKEEHIPDSLKQTITLGFQACSCLRESFVKLCHHFSISPPHPNKNFHSVEHTAEIFLEYVF